MPELLTKHPELALKILKDAKIKCGTDAKPQILVDCPKQNFCSLPTGELCIYGIKDITQMSQIQFFDVILAPANIFPGLLLVLFVLLLGVIIGTKIK